MIRGEGPLCGIHDRSRRKVHLAEGCEGRVGIETIGSKEVGSFE